MEIGYQPRFRWHKSSVLAGSLFLCENITKIKTKYWLDVKEGARELWRLELLPLGLKLIKQALDDISKGIIKKKPQDKELSTFEPSTNVKDIFKPDLLMIEEKCSQC